MHTAQAAADNALRLCFGQASVPALGDAVRRLARAVHSIRPIGKVPVRGHAHCRG
jgi:DNA-binding transcriptional MocR family regulator